MTHWTSTIKVRLISEDWSWYPVASYVSLWFDRTDTYDGNPWGGVAIEGPDGCYSMTMNSYSPEKVTVVARLGQYEHRWRIELNETNASNEWYFCLQDEFPDVSILDEGTSLRLFLVDSKGYNLNSQFLSTVTLDFKEIGSNDTMRMRPYDPNSYTVLGPGDWSVTPSAWNGLAEGYAVDQKESFIYDALAAGSRSVYVTLSSLQTEPPTPTDPPTDPTDPPVDPPTNPGTGETKTEYVYINVGGGSRSSRSAPQRPTFNQQFNIPSRVQAPRLGRR